MDKDRKNKSIPNNGGPAYPVSQDVAWDITNNTAVAGMTIRTAIAMHCMAGYSACPEATELIADKKAAWAVGDADALIAELTKDGGVL